MLMDNPRDPVAELFRSVGLRSAGEHSLYRGNIPEMRRQSVDLFPSADQGRVFSMVLRWSRGGWLLMVAVILAASMSIAASGVDYSDVHGDFKYSRWEIRGTASCPS